MNEFLNYYTLYKSIACIQFYSIVVWLQTLGVEIQSIDPGTEESGDSGASTKTGLIAGLTTVAILCSVLVIGGLVYRGKKQAAKATGSTNGVRHYQSYGDLDLSGESRFMNIRFTVAGGMLAFISTKRAFADITYAP